MRKQELVMQIIGGARQYSIGTVLFHQAVGELLGINVTDMKCLDIITLKSSATPSELAEHTGLSTGATTAMIDRLEKANLIERRPHPSDRRGTIVALTKQATRRLPEFFESLANAMQALVSGYSETELEILWDFFVKVEVMWKKEREKLEVRFGKGRRSGRRLMRQ
jgi:DNA-binding MarR family transcriptional regulator